MSDKEDSILDLEEDRLEDDLEEEAGRRLFAVGIPVVLVLLVVGFIGLSTGEKKSPEEPVPVKRTVHVSDLNPLEESALSVPIPFGRKARNECALTCYSTEVERELCLRGCNRYVAPEYARRITLDENDPAKLGARVTADCRTHAEKSERMQTADTWRAAVVEARRTLGDFRPSVELYESASLLPRFTVLELVEKTLGRPEGLGKNADAYAAALQTQVCVREILVATQLAIVQTAESRDLYSENFYRSLEKALLDENARLETSLNALGEKVL